jgi:hypothetical protein
MEEKEYEVFGLGDSNYLRQMSITNAHLALQQAKSESNMAVAQHWHDVLMESIEGDTDFEDSFKAFLDKYPTDSSVLEKSNSIKLAHPEKLNGTYYLIDGDVLDVKYITERNGYYVYDFSMQTNPKRTGSFTICREKQRKGKVEVKVVIGVDEEVKYYDTSIISDKDTFMSSITETIRRFVIQ